MLINAYSTRTVLPALNFEHVLRGSRDHSDDELAEHLNGFIGFVMDRGRRPMTQMRFAVIGHLRRVRYHLALEVEPPAMDAFTQWATEANALLFFADSSVRAPDGSVLVAPGTGEPGPNARVPYPADAVARKKSSDAALAARGLKVLPGLPPCVSEAEVDLRAVAEIVSRCLALMVCAVRAESLGSDPWPVAEIRAQFPRAVEGLSPSEAEFMANEKPEPQAVLNHGWRYEALATLAWSLGLMSELPFPSAIVDAGQLVKVVKPLHDGKLEGVRLPKVSEVLDALDLHYRLHWITTEAHAHGAQPPSELEPGVIAERHYALNWLTRFLDADWDDVETPT
jgi:hypothetical protein